MLPCKDNSGETFKQASIVHMLLSFFLNSGHWQNIIFIKSSNDQRSTIVKSQMLEQFNHQVGLKNNDKGFIKWLHEVYATN